jgi:hypothetical protein
MALEVPKKIIETCAHEENEQGEERDIKKHKYINELNKLTL